MAKIACLRILNFVIECLKKRKNLQNSFNLIIRGPDESFKPKNRGRKSNDTVPLKGLLP